MEPVDSLAMVSHERRRPPVFGYLALAGALAVVVGSFGPWLSMRFVFGDFSVRGTEGDGKITVVLGVISLVLLALRFAGYLGRWAAWLTVVLLGAAGVTGVVDWVDVQDRVSILDGDNEFGISAGVGWGLILVTIGGVIGMVTAVFHATSESPRRQSVIVPPPVPAWPTPPASETSVGDATTNAEAPVRVTHEW